MIKIGVFSVLLSLHYPSPNISPMLLLALSSTFPTFFFLLPGVTLDSHMVLLSTLRGSDRGGNRSERRS